MHNMNSSFFRMGHRILKWILSPEEYNEKSGDLCEISQSLVDEKGALTGVLWLWVQILKSVPVFIQDFMCRRSRMFGNYVKMTVRIMKRQWSYTFINIVGLAVGMTCFILLMLYVKYELSFDRFHQNGDQTYRVALQLPTWSFRNSTDYAITTAALAPVLDKEFPEVISATRLRSSSEMINSGDNIFLEHGLYADRQFLKIFTFPLISGNQSTVLAEPYSIVISEGLARKLYGNENPMGKVMILSKATEFTVTGVIKDIPRNSHLTFDYLISFSTLIAQGRRDLASWGTINYATYIHLQENHSPAGFEKKLIGVVDKYHTTRSEEEKRRYYLQPLSSIHLRSHLNFEISENSDIKYVYLFATIAFIILIVGCINYINLATAWAVKRYKEVGIRKTIGARKSQLVRQFLAESLSLSLVAIIVSIILVLITLPHFSAFVDRSIDLSMLSHWGNLLGLVGLFTSVGVLSGGYSALLLSSYQPVQALNSNQKGRRPLRLRNVLVVFQFCISIVLIISTLTIQKQLHFIKYGDVGYTRDNIVTVRLRDDVSRNKAELIKEDLLKNPLIPTAALSNRPPIKISNVSNAEIEGNNTGEMLAISQINSAYIDHDYIDMYDIQVLDGRNFSMEFQSDTEHGVIVNETTVKMMGIDQPIGKRFSRHDVKDGRIIGVIKDFHFATFRLKIEPMMFLLRPERANMISIKIPTENIQESLAFIEATFHEHNPGSLFDYSFINDAFGNIYRSEQKLGTILTVFSCVAIIIASMGLFGLISFVTERKTREVGIRKVLGASVVSIVTLIIDEFLILVLVSNVIAVPIAYYLMKQWLESFVYRTPLSPAVFVVAGISVLVIAVLTVLFQSLKAATLNPVKSLRYE